MFATPDETERLLLEHLTWPEVADALESGKTTMVVPVGAVEQHGPHLPLCVDAERGTRLGWEIAERLGNALVAPTIRVGCSDHHMDFPGTISLRETTLRAVCVDYCVSLSRHGFTRICMVPSHGGNFAPLAGMLEELNQAVEPGCTVLAYTDLLGFLAVWKQVVEEETGLAERVGGHADIAEGSVMMAIRPDLVKADRLDPDGEREGMRVQGVSGYHRFDQRTRHGGVGDPRPSTAQMGEALLEASAAEVARDVVAIRALKPFER